MLHGNLKANVKCSSQAFPLGFYWPICCWVAYCMMNFACDSSQWFHSIQPSCTCFAIDFNNISHAGNKLQGRCAEVDLWRRKATLQLSVFFQGDCALVRTRQPEINVSKRRFRGEGVIAVVGSRAIMFDKMGPSNPAEHFSQRLPKCAV